MPSASSHTLQRAPASDNRRRKQRERAGSLSAVHGEGPERWASRLFDDKIDSDKPARAFLASGSVWTPGASGATFLRARAHRLEASAETRVRCGWARPESSNLGGRRAGGLSHAADRALPSCLWAPDALIQRGERPYRTRRAKRDKQQSLSDLEGAGASGTLVGQWLRSRRPGPRRSRLSDRRHLDRETRGHGP